MTFPRLSDLPTRQRATTLTATQRKTLELPPLQRPVMAESEKVNERRRKRKRKALTLKERVTVIKRSDQGETAIEIANSLGVGKTQIQTIIREKEVILRRWYGGESGDRKLSKIRRTASTVIDEQIWDWFCEMRQKNIPVTGKLIQEKALCLAVARGFNDFRASKGWLENWMKRHNVYQACLRDGNWKEEIKQYSICQTHKKQTQAPVVTPSNISKPLELRLKAQTMASQLMSDSSLKKYQADTPEHIDDPDVIATALSCLPESENSLPQCDLSVVVKEKVCDNVDMKTEESDESHILTALSTPSDTDSSSHDMLDNNTFVITDTSCTESDTETAQCLPVRRTASEMISRKLRQRYSHIGKGLRMHEKERRLVRKYMKSETDRNISEIKLNKVKLKIALLKKQKLQLQMLMVQRRLNLQNR